MNAVRPLAIAESLAAFTQILSTAEAIRNSEREYGGINYWPDSKYILGFVKSSSFETAVSRPGVVQGLLLARIMACVTLLFPKLPNSVRQGSSAFIFFN